MANTPLGAAVPARVPPADPPRPHAGGVDQQMQRIFCPAMRTVHRKRPPAPAEGAEIGHNPVPSRQPQEAFHKAPRHAHAKPGGVCRAQSAEAPCRTAPPWSGTSGSPHRGMSAICPWCRKVRRPGSSPHRTRSSATRGAWVPRCRQPGSRSRSSGDVGDVGFLRQGQLTHRIHDMKPRRIGATGPGGG